MTAFYPKEKNEKRMAYPDLLAVGAYQACIPCNCAHAAVRVLIQGKMSVKKGELTGRVRRSVSFNSLWWSDIVSTATVFPNSKHPHFETGSNLRHKPKIKPLLAPSHYSIPSIRAPSILSPQLISWPSLSPLPLPLPLLFPLTAQNLSLSFALCISVTQL